MIWTFRKNIVPPFSGQPPVYSYSNLWVMTAGHQSFEEAYCLDHQENEGICSSEQLIPSCHSWPRRPQCERRNSVSLEESARVQVACTEGEMMYHSMPHCVCPPANLKQTATPTEACYRHLPIHGHIITRRPSLDKPPDRDIWTAAKQASIWQASEQGRTFFTRFILPRCQ